MGDRWCAGVGAQESRGVNGPQHGAGQEIPSFGERICIDGSELLLLLLNRWLLREGKVLIVGISLQAIPDVGLGVDHPAPLGNLRQEISVDQFLMLTATQVCLVVVSGVSWITDTVSISSVSLDAPCV